MNLVIDDGNTRTKIGSFIDDAELQVESPKSDQELRDLLNKNHFINVMVSSVKGRTNEILSWLPSATRKFALSSTTRLPFRNGYKTPETLGLDRLAAAAGAVSLFPGRNCLVIDAGTCITYEFINNNGEYLGGAISPGVTMRFQAMHKFTAKLPLIAASLQPELVGRSTEECIQSGVMNGMEEEIRGIIERYRSGTRDLQVILCGGDASLFENIGKPSIFVAPNLVLLGLRAILMHNVAD